MNRTNRDGSGQGRGKGAALAIAVASLAGTAAAFVLVIALPEGHPRDAGLAALAVILGLLAAVGWLRSALPPDQPPHERQGPSAPLDLACAAHDLAQPVRATGMLLAMLERAGVEDAKAKAILRDLRAAHVWASELVRGLLDHAKVEGGLSRPTPIEVQVGPLLRQVAQDFAFLAAERGQRLAVVPCTATVLSDPILLQRIIRNLVANALQYAPQGRIVIGGRRRGSMLSIEVHDTGPGIPEDHLDRIFRAFHRVAEREDGDMSIGLGLFIAHRLAKVLGHRLDVRSRRGRGSVFSLEVPLLLGGSVASGPVGALEGQDRLGAAGHVQRPEDAGHV